MNLNPHILFMHLPFWKGYLKDLQKREKKTNRPTSVLQHETKMKRLMNWKNSMRLNMNTYCINLMKVQSVIVAFAQIQRTLLSGIKPDMDVCVALGMFATSAIRIQNRYVQVPRQFETFKSKIVFFCSL